MTSTVTSPHPTMMSPEQENEKTGIKVDETLSDLWLYAVGVVCGGLSLAGIAANGVTVLLWSGRRGLPCVPYFLALALYDSLFLLALLLFTCSAEFVRRLPDPGPVFATFYQPSLVFSIFFMNVVTFGSVYTTACLATERCLAVVRPLTWPQTRSGKRTVVVLVLVLVWSIFVNIPSALEGKLSWVYDQKYNRTILRFVHSDYHFQYFHRHVYMLYLFPAVSFVVPVVSIFVINFILVYKVCTRHRGLITAGLSTAAPSLRKAAASSDSQSLTKQVIVISFLTLLSRCVITLMFVWMAVEGLNHSSQSSLACHVLNVLGNLMLVVNASANFFCYLYFTRTFRRLFLQRFPCWLRCGHLNRGQTGSDDSTVVSISVVNTSQSLSL